MRPAEEGVLAVWYQTGIWRLLRKPRQLQGLGDAPSHLDSSMKHVPVIGEGEPDRRPVVSDSMSEGTKVKNRLQIVGQPGKVMIGCCALLAFLWSGVLV